MHAQTARRAKHILTLLEIKSTQEAHREQELASDYWGQYSRDLCTKGEGRAEKWQQHLGVREKKSTHMHAHTWPPWKAAWLLRAHGWLSDSPICLAQNFSSCGLLTNYSFFSPLKAQTYLQFQTYSVKF